MESLHDERVCKNHKDVLDELGFDTKLPGYKYFLSASTQIQEALQIVEDSNLDSVLALFPRDKTRESFLEFLKSVYLEDYAFGYECGKKKYMGEMQQFIDSCKYAAPEQKELQRIVFGDDNIERDDYVLRSAAYFNHRNITIDESQKVLSKTIVNLQSE